MRGTILLMDRRLPVLLLFSLLYWNNVSSQTSYPFKVATDRMLWHDKIDNQQKKLLNDGVVKIANDESINLQIDDALIRRVDDLQENIELDSALSRQQKIKYLLSIESMLRGYVTTRGNKDYPASIAPALMTAFEECLELDKKDESIEPVIAKNSYGTG